MSDEAVVRIVLEGDEGSNPTPPALSPQRQESQALLRGDAMPWAPPDKPIQAPVLEGMRRDQAEYLRLESEAARRGISVKDYKKAEVEGSATIGVLPTTAATAPDPNSDEETAGRRKEREDARNKRLADFSQAPSLTPPEPPKSAPVPVAVVEPPKPVPPPAAPSVAPPVAPSATPVPPPAAPPAAKAEVPVVDSLAERLRILDEEIAKREAVDPETGSPMHKKLEDLRQQREELTAPPPTAQLLHDPVAIAKKRVEREALLAAVDAEYAKLKPPPPKADPPFDPVAVAKKRVEAEKNRAAVDAEYAKLKPKSATDSLLDLAQSIRGTLGGTLGTVVGAGLDIVSNVRKNKTTGAAVGGEDVGDAATEVGSSMAALVPVVGTTIAVVGGLTKAFTSLLGVANEMANRYGEYNPEIAQAQATAEIRQIMGDMRRSQDNSKELVELIQAQSEMQQKWEDIKTAAMSKIIPVLTGVLEVLGSLLGIASRPDMKEIEDPTSAILGGKVGGLGSTEMVPDL